MDLNEMLAHNVGASVADAEGMSVDTAEWHVLPYAEVELFVENLQKKKPVAVRQLEWENATSDGALSEYFADVNQPIFKAVKKAYGIATELLAAMDCPERYKLRLTSTYTGETKQKNLVVDTAVFDDKSISLGERVDLFCAATIRQAMQATYTPADAYEAIKNPTIRTLAAIIEQQRLENICAMRTPGYQAFLEKQKNYDYERSIVTKVVPTQCPLNCPGCALKDIENLKNYVRKRRADLPLLENETDCGLSQEECFIWYKKLELSQEDCLYFLHYFTLMLSLPQRLKVDEIRYFAFYLKEAHKLLTPFPTEWSEVRMAAVGIYNLLCEIRIKTTERRMEGGAYTGTLSNVPQKSRNENESTADGTGNEYLEAEGPAKNSGNGSDDSQTKSKRKAPAIPGERKNGPSGDVFYGEGKDGEAKESAESEATAQLTEAEIEKITNSNDSFSEAFNEWEKKLAEFAPQIHHSSVNYSHNLFFNNAQIIEGSVKFGTNRNIKFIAAQPEKMRYKKAYDAVKNLVTPIRKAFKAHYRHTETIFHNLRNGTLDPTKLAEAKQSVPNVYMRHARVITDKVSVALVVDESASMKTDLKSQSAREVAVLLTEAIKDVPEMELFIYGHHADVGFPLSTTINVYRDNTHRAEFTLGSTKAEGCNRDGIAFKEIALDIRKQTANKILMIAICDGYPNAENYRGEAAVDDTRRKVREIERMGFSVMQVSLKGGVDSKLMFRHWVNFDNMPLLAHDLGLVVKQAVERLAERRVELY